MSAELLLLLILMTDRVNEVLAENSPFPGLNAQILSGFTRLVYLNWGQFFFPTERPAQNVLKRSWELTFQENYN